MVHIALTDQFLKVMEEDWDVLIILDACRYDYFENLVKNYFLGELEKRVSVGSHTSEWCKNSFTSSYSDVIYISGNPYINSKIEVKGFDGKSHFYKVIDVWEFGWNEKLGTVLPQSINLAALDSITKYPSKKCIIHYIQPHAPYISNRFFIKGYPNPFVEGPLVGVQGYKTNRLTEWLIKLLGFLLIKAKVIKHKWWLRQFFKLPPGSPMEVMRRTYGVRGLREGYKENLCIVMEYSADLCRKILADYPTKKIQITADHGEFLGENGRYSHRSGIKHPLLIEVPWFKVDGIKQKPRAEEILEESVPTYTDADKVKLKAKIKKMRDTYRL